MNKKLTKKEFYDIRNCINSRAINNSDSIFNRCFEDASKEDSWPVLINKRSVLNEYDRNNTNCIGTVYFMVSAVSRFPSIDNKYRGGILYESKFPILALITKFLFPSLSIIKFLIVYFIMLLLSELIETILVVIFVSRKREFEIIDNTFKNMNKYNDEYYVVPKYNKYKSFIKVFSKELPVSLYAYKRH